MRFRVDWRVRSFAQAAAGAQPETDRLERVLAINRTDGRPRLDDVAIGSWGVTMILPDKESLKVEFKSDRKGLPDEDLIETVVGMANAEGGDIFLGVEDDGTPTGLHPRHAATEMLAAMIGNRTQPSVAARVETQRAANGKDVVRISVPMMREIVMTSSGKLLRRRLSSNGEPCTMPMHPYEIASRQSRFGRFDFSAQPCPDATPSDIDPAERLRLRQTITTYRGDRSLVDLSDEELDGALGLVTRVEGISVPTHAGMLLIGRPDRLRTLVPTHEVLFQELQGTNVRANEGMRLPLIALAERVAALFDGRYAEEEMMSGMFRVPLPNYDRAAFREGLINALSHRDYAVNNAVYVRFTDDGLSISNPGGFVEGVSTENILVAEPHSRNPLLADALKRIGLAERTGRGVDNIFRAVLRAGRPMPAYSESAGASVKLQFPSRAADTTFVNLLIKLRERLGSEPNLEMLIVLRALRDAGEASHAELSRLAQRPVEEALSTLHEAGVITSVRAEGVRLARVAGEAEDAADDQVHLRRRIMEHMATKERITRREAAGLLAISEDQTKRLLTSLVDAGELTRDGRGRSTSYTRHSQ